MSPHDTAEAFVLLSLLDDARVALVQLDREGISVALPFTRICQAAELLQDKLAYYGCEDAGSA